VTKNKSNLSQTSTNPKIGFRFIFFIVLLFYFVPLLASAAGTDSARFTDYLYLYTTVSYTVIVVSIIIFSERGLDVIQDHFSLWVIVLGCFLAAGQGSEHDTVYKIFLILLGFRLSFHIIENRYSLKIPDWKPTFISLLWSVVTFVIIALLLFVLNPVRESLPPNLSRVLLNTFLYQVSFVTVIEEAYFRGLLYSFLLMNGYQEDRALIIQGILFWGGHYLKISASPAIFFVAVPILTLSTSLIIKKYKMLYVSIMVHTLVNVLEPVLNAIL
jgi:hypothetical protein